MRALISFQCASWSLSGWWKKGFHIPCISQKVRYILQKKPCKKNDIVRLSYFSLPPCPNSDNWKSDKSKQLMGPMGPSLLDERLTNLCPKEVSVDKESLSGFHFIFHFIVMIVMSDMTLTTIELGNWWWGLDKKGNFLSKNAAKRTRQRAGKNYSSYSFELTFLL